MTTTRAPILAVAALLAAGAAVPGCGREPRPPMGRVSGKVTYKGQPFDAGMVVFNPAGGPENSTGQPATGKIAADGSYRLTTFDDGDGALVGEHIVMVKASKLVRTAKPAKNDVEQIRQPGPDGKLSYVHLESRIPSKYANPSKTPLRFTVKPGDNAYNIDLTD
jgi:hypothetical protein